MYGIFFGFAIANLGNNGKLVVLGIVCYVAC